MDKNTDKNPGATNPKIEYLGIGGFLFIWVKVIAMVAALVLILKYVFKVPFTF